MSRGSSNVLPKKLMCPPCCGLFSQRLGIALGLPRWGRQRAWGSSRRPCYGHSGAWDEKSVGVNGVNLVTDGTVSGLGRLTPTKAEQGVGLV
jgi:hypothetical protein